MHGGGQEKEMRPGTENGPAIAGFGLAASLTGANQKQKAAALASLKLTFYRGLQQEGIDFFINGPPAEESAVHIITAACPGRTRHLRFSRFSLSLPQTRTELHFASSWLKTRKA